MEAYIVAGYRSAVGKAKRGGFKNYRTDDLAVDVIKHLTSQVPELDTTKVDDVIVGCANPEGEQGLQVARLISARALGKEVPGVTINRYCASGLEAISMAVSKVRAGFGHIFVAGGIESMSLIPMTGYKLSPSYKANMENMNYHIGMDIQLKMLLKNITYTEKLQINLLRSLTKSPQMQLKRDCLKMRLFQLLLKKYLSMMERKYLNLIRLIWMRELEGKQQLKL